MAKMMTVMAASMRSSLRSPVRQKRRGFAKLGSGAVREDNSFASQRSLRRSAATASTMTVMVRSMKRPWRRVKLVRPIDLGSVERGCSAVKRATYSVSQEPQRRRSATAKMMTAMERSMRSYLNRGGPVKWASSGAVLRASWTAERASGSVKDTQQRRRSVTVWMMIVMVRSMNTFQNRGKLVRRIALDAVERECGDASMQNVSVSPLSRRRRSVTAKMMTVMASLMRGSAITVEAVVRLQRSAVTAWMMTVMVVSMRV